MIKHLLARDSARRVVGIEGHLIRLEDLKAQSWDYSEPTLVSRGGKEVYSEHSICPNTATFKASFYKRYPELEGVPLDGLLIAGGAVGQFLPIGGKQWTASDVDIFLYGHASVEAANKRLHRLIDDIAEGCHAQGKKDLRGRLQELDLGRQTKKETLSENEEFALRVMLRAVDDPRCVYKLSPNGKRMVLDLSAFTSSDNQKIIADCERKIPTGYWLPEVIAVRTAGSLTITLEDTRIQVIFRHYKTASEILHGFDLGSAAAGFDGDQVLLTELGQFAYEYCHNIIDTTRRSATYEARLDKYIKRGFDVIMPDLDINKLPTRNLEYGYAEVVKFPRAPFAFSKREGNRIFLDRFVKHFGPASDYDLQEEIEEGGYSLAYLNLRRLVNSGGEKPPHFIYSAESRGLAAARDVLTKAPHLTLSMIQRLYDGFRDACWDGAHLNTRTLKNYVPSVSLRTITQKVYVEGRAMEDVIDEAFATQRDEATRAWKSAIQDADHTILPWVTENPGGQHGPLTGSLNPILEDPAEWYGKYLRSGES